MITGLAMWINLSPTNADGRQIWLGRDVSTRLGLDLQGGTQVLLQAQDPNVNTEIMETARQVIENRVNGLGVAEAVVQVSGENRIIVEIPGIDNSEEAVETVRSAGRLEFIDPQGQDLTGQIVRTSGNDDPIALRPTPVPTATATLTDTDSLTGTDALSPTDALTGTTGTEPTGPVYQSITDGRDLDTNSVQPRIGGATQPGQSPYAVLFAFRGDSATNLASFTGQNVNRPMCIVLDNVVVSCPIIQSALIDGSGEITVQDRAAVDQLYNQLRYGALPTSLSVESSRSVSATLGEDSVNASVIAGIVGLTVVVLFMLLYYRLPGFLAVVALMIYTAITFALYKLIPVTLTSAGIAGFILSIGVAVDANVLIFARLKEELRKGKGLRPAIEAGFEEAWPAIRDSSVATLITSTILFLFGNSFGVSIVTGFALTLGLGIIISLFTAVVVTRTLLRLIVPLRFVQNPWLFELEEAAGLESGRRSEVTA
jgi:preprotein translocase subunit SecD